ncbi:hypothetical protein PR048_012951, partial [Dryococelus australis]
MNWKKQNSIFGILKQEEHGEFHHIFPDLLRDGEILQISLDFIELLRMLPIQNNEMNSPKSISAAERLAVTM